ncbi:hypothetical protein B0H17DRAFT_1102171 [Mycena rosella]|uniref:Uncharacterized protein n=1 Tax=Mycena rosella TaxID=1033263 RepID=A0AAD7CI08_MYCRO|nr:hypothetical protein B0H17DRAFT_1102171 [Mycena rosella]
MKRCEEKTGICPSCGRRRSPSTRGYHYSSARCPPRCSSKRNSKPSPKHCPV